MNTFGRRVGVELVGDGSSVERMWVESAAAASSSSTKMVEATGKVTEAQIAGTVKQIKSLKLQEAAFAAAAVSETRSAQEREAAAIRLAGVQKRLASVTGVSTVATGEAAAATAAFGIKTKTAERDIGKTARGLLAGSGAASALGRSLAFASSGFIAFAAGATLIRASIKASLDLAATQRQVQAQLKTSGKTWQEYSGQVDATDLKLSHISGFTNQELLQSFGYLVRVTGNVSTALKLNATAADVARGRHIALSSASLALAKALGGSDTALRRLGIIIPKDLKGMDALNYVAQKFAGQAKAGATVSDRFHASLVNVEEVIGTALLPTFTHLTRSLTEWFQKMTETGRLQRDVTDTVSVLGDAFHVLGAVIGTVDKVTGGFKNTLEALLAVFAVRKILVFGEALTGLAAKWGLVTAAATEAGAAETAAIGEGAAGAAGAGAIAGRGAAVAGGEAAAAGGLALGIPEIVAIIAAVIADQRLQGPRKSFQEKLGPAGFLVSGPTDVAKGFKNAVQNASDALQSLVGWEKKTEAVITPGLRNLGRGGNLAPSFFPNIAGAGPRGGAAAGPFSAARPITVYKSFTEGVGIQLAQARAALTKSTQDDVAAAKAEVAQIKREIDHGHLAGASLIQALQAEAGAVSTIQAAQAAAIQKQTDRIQAQIDPLRLEVTLSRAQALGKSTLPALRALRAAAQRVIASGKATLEQQKEAYDQIASLNSEIKAASQQGIRSFTESIKLQVALAREQAFGKSTTATLEAMKKAALKALRSGKYTGQALIDLYNEIASINQQLQSATTKGMAQFKQLNLDKLTSGLGLTPQQRKALRARFSQVGPGGTVPATGTGAYGYTISDSGRPIHVHSHISIDGKKVADNTTRHQHRRRRRNSSQRRGPNAGSSG